MATSVSRWLVKQRKSLCSRDAALPSWAAALAGGSYRPAARRPGGLAPATIEGKWERTAWLTATGWDAAADGTRCRTSLATHADLALILTARFERTSRKRACTVNRSLSGYVEGESPMFQVCEHTEDCR